MYTLYVGTYTRVLSVGTRIGIPSVHLCTCTDVLMPSAEYLYKEIMLSQTQTKN